MKIALVSPYDFAYPGGVTAHVSRLESNFTRMGHKVTILAPSSSPADKLGHSNLVILGKPVPIHASGSVVRISVSPLLFFSRSLRQWLKQEAFDIIHLHEPLCPTVPMAVLNLSPDTVNVGTFHAFRSGSLGYRLWKPILRRWFDRLDGRIAVSRPAMDFVSRYLPGEYTIIPNGIDIHHFHPEAAPIERYCDDKLNILFVGRLEKRKGLIHLLRAYERVKRELPGCRLLVVGPGGGLRKKRYERMVDRHHLEDVEFVGFTSYGELPRYYRTADVFCAPATERESFGIVLLEAMAAARPIVCSDVEGYAGLLNPGVEGLMTPRRDERALAEALLCLLNDRALREKMGAAGRARAEEYSWERVSARVMDYYHWVSNNSRRVSR